MCILRAIQNIKVLNINFGQLSLNKYCRKLLQKFHEKRGNIPSQLVLHA